MKRYFRKLKCKLFGHKIVRFKAISGRRIAICSRCGKVWKIKKKNKA